MSVEPGLRERKKQQTRQLLERTAQRMFTQRGFWARIVVFGGSLLLYAWVVRLMTREHSTAGIVLFSLLALFSVAGLIVTLMRRPSRRPR